MNFFRLCKIRWVLLGLIFLYFTGGSLSDAASFQGLGIPRYNTVSGVSPDGTVVLGFSHVDHPSGSEAFRWTKDNGRIGLGDLPGGDFASSAHASSFDGSIIVGQGKSDSGREAFRWTEDGGMVGLGSLPDGILSSCAFDVSADGSIIVGQRTTCLGSESFRWTAGLGMMGLGNLPGGSFEFGTRASAISADGNVVVGGATSAAAPVYEAYHWTLEEGMVGLGDLPGGEFRSEASDVSADGSVIVGWSNSANCSGSDYEAFRWTVEEGMVGLGDLPGGKFNSEAIAVSGDGSVVVGVSSSSLYNEAFIWDVNSGMRSLKDVLIDDFSLDLEGWKLYYATGVSANGLTIVGWGETPTGNIGSWIAEIPEPCALSLLFLGGLMVRKRRL